jgi:hypothetical protein
MKNISKLLVLNFLVVFSACSVDDGSSKSGDSFYDSDTGNGSQSQAGLITAGEWNDLTNWDFWENLMNGQDYSEMPTYWDFYTNNRISILLKNNGVPVINAKVELQRNNAVIWTSKSDNFGQAELWVGLFQKEESVDLSSLSLKINDVLIDQELVLYENGVNEISGSFTNVHANSIEICFIVDATGSMGDELEFLKDDLENVIETVKNDDSALDIFTSAVFYRDQGDEYVTRTSDFTNNLDTTINFINNQSANGGGDFPEAVHTGLRKGIDELQWSDNVKTKIVFLLLDAPPHYTAQIKENLHQIIMSASQKGIKIIPITASGIDKKTEFLMRFMSISTNGTYVFITNDSGIGNDHLEASVGQYEVEFLNELMVRLIKKYSE